MKKLFALFLILTLLTSLVSAERFVNYNLKEGRIDINNNFVTTNTDVANANAIGFTCLDSNCETLGERIFNNQVVNSGSSSSMQLTYPTTLLSQYGYAVYYFKDGFIPWESNPNWWGTNPSDPAGPFSVYLSKQESCSSQIEQIDIRNTERINTPVVIDVKARLNAQTDSAVSSGTGPLKAIPDEIKNQYTVKTLVNLDIYSKFDSSLVYTTQQELNILFGENGNVEFNFIPRSFGDFRAVVTTKVTDDKCISNSIISKQKDFFVLSEDQQNMCYTQLGDLKLNNTNLKTNDNLIINFDKLSNLQIDKEVIQAIPTSLKLELKDANTNEIVFEQSFVDPENTNTVDLKRVELSITIPGYIRTGLYDLVLTGTGSDVRCDNDNKHDQLIANSLSIVNNDGFNFAPKIISEPTKTAKLNEFYFYDVNAIDPNGDRLTYSLLSSPVGMNIDQNTGLITWNVDSTYFVEGQNVNVIVIVSDGFFFDLQFYSIKIANSNQNGIISKHNIKFSGVDLEANNADGINGFIQIKNTGNFKENGLTLTADIYDLDVHEVLTNNLNLGKEDSFWIPVNIELQKYVPSGEYLLNLKISNNKFSEEITIVLPLANNK